MATAKKTPTPSPEVLAASRDLLRAIKLARDLPDLERALRALPSAGDAGVHAMQELKPHNLPLRKGSQPHEDAIAWTSEQMLCAGEGGLCDPHVLPRPVEAPKAAPERKAKDQEVPASGVQATAANDRTADAPLLPEGHDPAEAAEALRRAFERERYEVKDIIVKPRSRGAQVVLKLVKGGKAVNKPVDLSPGMWAMPLRELAEGLAEAFVAAGAE